MNNKQLFIGMMSGTSADAIDAVLVDFEKEKPQLLGQHSLNISPELQKQIHQLTQSGNNEIDRCGALDITLGELFAECSLQLLEKKQFKSEDIQAIGSHGQTVRHRPPGSAKKAFTLQIGDPNTIVQRTNITTIADFRRRDMAAGGQGAPLVPGFHRAIFSSTDKNRVIANIGGMSNITLLPKSGEVSGFDTGPGNVLMDLWCQRHLQQAFDNNGEWASGGKVNKTLLGLLLQHPFFHKAAPKSTGREDYDLDWLESCITASELQISTQDIQSTLLELTVVTLTQAIQQEQLEYQELYLCGGGAYNLELQKRLRQHLPNCEISSTASLGVDPQWVEAMAFAWLAKQTLTRKSGNIPAVTGASEELILGGVYFS